MADYRPIVRYYACVVCTQQFVMKGRGRPPSYCSPHCRYVSNVERNGEQIKASVVAWQGVNGRDYQRRDRAAKPDQFRLRDRADYLKHKAAHNARTLAYKRSHPDRIRHSSRSYQHRRRLRLIAAGPTMFTVRDWDRLAGRYRGCCAYCGAKPKKLEIDHVMPVSRGGRHSIGNVLPACPPCNRAKGAKFLVEWRYQNKARSESSRVHGVVLPPIEGRMGGGVDRPAAVAAGDSRRAVSTTA